MNVTVITATPDPVAVISAAAGTCYGKSDTSARRVEGCYRRGHMSPFEHVSVTFKASDISRACSHQLVRHRLASYNQQSQRYCRIETDADYWYIIPPAYSDDRWYHEEMQRCAQAYKRALDQGLRPEDARYLLPEACKTEIVVTMNCRELFHFLDVRLDPAAQWEIRGLASAMVDALKAVDGWRELMALREGEGGDAR